MPTIPYNIREKIIAQSLQEIRFARQYKQGKVKNWKINEDLYYSRKIAPTDSRANVDLGKMSAFVHTIMAKIDTPLVFKFLKRKLSQLKRVDQLNALRVADQQKDDWDIKDIAGKKQGLIYGRAVYSYYADSIDGKYKAHLDNVDVYDFLIDPAAGGLDIERAMYLGDYGVVKTRDELKTGMKSGVYSKTETQRLLDGSGNSTEMNQEEVNKKNRTQDTNVYTTQKEITNKDKFKFWRWGTTYDGVRYYLLLSEKGGTAIEITELSEKFESELWWYWTWAAFIDLTEFWNPSYCDYVREVFMAQAVSIDQMLDNAEQINKPQRAVQVGAIENMAQLKYRREGVILIKKDVDINKAYQTVITPSISTPIEVFNILEGIQEKASGVTAGAQGDAKNDSNSTATIYEGNQENSADRFGLLNRSYAFGYRRFAKLYEWGVREHLVKKIAVDILGPDGVEIIEVSRRDIFRKDESFNISVEASNAETALSNQEKSTKISFLQAQANMPTPPGQAPVQNPKKAYEIMAGIAGFDPETIRELQDTSDFGTAGIMSEADRDIERLIDGEKFPPNQAANTAYKQRFVDYMVDNQENIDNDQFKMLAEYVLLLDPVITRNMVRQANDFLMKQKLAQLATPPPQIQNPPVVPDGKPVAPVPPTNKGLLINKK